MFFTAAGLIAGFILPPLYRASALMYAQLEPPDPLYRTGTITLSRIDEIKLAALVNTITSSEIMRRAADKLKAQNQVPQGMNEPDIMAALFRGAGVRHQSQELMKVMCAHRNPVFAANAANAIANAFIEWYREDTIKTSTERVGFLNNRKEHLEKELDRAEKRLEEFRQMNYQFLREEASQKIGELLGKEAVPDIDILKYTEFQSDYIRLNLERKENIKKKEYLQELLNKESEYLSCEELPEESILYLQKELIKKRYELSNALTKYTEEYPEVRQLKLDISQIEKTLREQSECKTAKPAKDGERLLPNTKYQKLKEELQGIDIKLESIGESIRLKELYLKSRGKNIEELTQRRSEFEKLQREREVFFTEQKDISSRLDSALAVLDLELKGRGSGFWMREPAQPPLWPEKPKKDLLIIGGLLFGLFVGLSAVYLIDITDQTFDNAEELSSFLKIPVLGVTSRIISPHEMRVINDKKKVVFLYAGGILIIGFALFVLLVFLKIKFFTRIS